MKNGVMLAIGASLIFSVMNALVKAVSLTIPPAEIVFFRSMIGTVIIYCMMRFSKVTFSTTGISLLVMRGILGAFYLLAYFYTIATIPLTDASILAHLAPIFVVFLSGIFLREKLSRRALWVLPLVVLGAVLLVKPFRYSSYTLDALIGVLSALLAAGAAISIRLLSKQHHTYEIVFYFLSTATIISIPLMWNNVVIPNFIELCYLACIGIVSLLGQIFLTRAFTHENAIVVEVTRYIGIVFNAMWGLFFWLEVPDTLTISGGILIITGCIALSWKKQAAQRVRANITKGSSSL